MGGSAFAQVFNQIGELPPNVEHPKLLVNFFQALQELRHQGFALAYHDRSDGGLFVTLCEMAFASHCGLDIDMSALSTSLANSAVQSILFNEELGSVIQIRQSDLEQVQQILKQAGLAEHSYPIAKINGDDQIRLYQQQEQIYEALPIDYNGPGHVPVMVQKIT